MANQLRNGVSDLKAEWLLIKREVQELRTSNHQLREGQEDIKEDAGKLKNRIEDIWSEIQVLEVSWERRDRR